MARCLRRILRIPAAFVSRVSNATVLARAGLRPFSQQVLVHQIHLLRKAALAEPGHPLRKDCFYGSTLSPQIGTFIRRVGRPRQEWTSQLLREGEQRFGDALFQTLLSDRTEGAEKRWKADVEKIFA